MSAHGEVGQIRAALQPVGDVQGVGLRRADRRRVRLWSGKILTADCRFLTECQVYDVSNRGMRLALSRNVALPNRVQVFIDATDAIVPMTVAWRRGAMIGAKFFGFTPGRTATRSDLYALKNRYYAVSNV